MSSTVMRVLAALVVVVSVWMGTAPGAGQWVSPAPWEEVSAQGPGEGENAQAGPASDAAVERVTHPIYLKSRQIDPGPGDQSDLDQISTAGKMRVHLIVQLDFIPRQAARAELARQGLNLLAYLPEYAWIASIDSGVLPQVMNLPGVVWAGTLQTDDKLDEAIRREQLPPYTQLANGQTAFYVLLQADEDLETGRALVRQYGGNPVSAAVGANLLVVEMPAGNARGLASEDAVQWIEPAAPIFGPTNDGIRQQIGVNTVQASPYNLDGTGIDVLVYDSGNVGAHVDFGTRLWSGGDDVISEHSTHVAGTIGGDGSNSLAQGASVANQWRGMAPNVDLISYGTGWTSGIIFYEDVGDIEADFAAAQNNRGADLANASVGSNVYDNYPSRCDIMGNYGASDVIIDQMIRGGNSAVGIGDKYITIWAAGNERNNSGSCSNTYSSIAPPAAAKNPIHVGAINTNNNSMTSFSSWGPTDDGRIKPTLVSGGCQSNGDFGIMSTDNSPVDDYRTMCGTSMASPSVTGSVALMLQEYRLVYNTTGNFWPSTAKALLIQTATDLGNPGPDYQFGYGLVDIQAAVDLINRHGLVQASIADDEWRVYSLMVPSSANPLRVSLAWDDREATLNANPALINNLDLELVSPGGTTWRPWRLDPANPANNATRGVDNRNNQEQVEVTAPEAGTWMVKVHGTSVPNGPQDYSLACEGCREVSLGVCSSTPAANPDAAAAFLPQTEGPQLQPAPDVTPETTPPTPGEAWQATLEAGQTPEQADQARQMLELEQARQAGAGALRAALDRLSGEALNQAIAELDELLKHEPRAAAAETAAISPDEEAQSNQAATGAQSDPAEGTPPESADPAPADSLAPTADLTVGPGCTYASIAAAITAANPGDRLRLAGNVTFNEHLTVSKNLTIEGGYNGCSSASSLPTTINGTSNGRVLDITLGTVSLSNLIIINGNTTVEGGGIRFGISGPGTLTLTNVEVHHNSGLWGGGIWIGSNANLNATNLNLHHNTGTSYGGGLRLWGGHATLVDSSIQLNSAPSGGGVYATLESSAASALYLTSSNVYSNSATSTDGGGVYLNNSSLVLYSGAITYNTAAVYGGGIAAYNSTVTMGVSPSFCSTSPCLRLENNTASSYGGGLFVSGGTATINYSSVMNNSGTYGGGAYVLNGTLYANGTLIARNDATSSVGDGVRLNSSATLNGVSVTFANNNASGATTGRAIDLASSTVNLSCSVIWNHSISLNNTAQNVDYSDVQGGYSGVANLNTNPLFVNSGAADFHLQSGSPVRDRCLTGSNYDFDMEIRPVLLSQPASPFDMGADEVAGTNRVGVDGACSYPTIQQAVNAAPAGATIRVAAGTFFETVDVNKSLTIRGGYDATCTTSGAGTTSIEASLTGGSVIDASGASTLLNLRDLELKWGTTIGGGLHLTSSAQATLDNVRVEANHGSYGGGIYVGPGSTVTTSNGSIIRHNTASTAGGGVRVWGTFNGYDTSSDIATNCAPDGGGLSVPGGTLLLDNADVVDNQAAGATGKGGGIHVTSGGQVTLRNSVFIGETSPGPNEAYDGAGIYADASTVHLEGTATTIAKNDATHFGGGIYLANSSMLTSTGSQVGSTVFSNAGSTAVIGAGIYSENSTINFSGGIYNNRATTSGGGIYAIGGTLNLTDAFVGGTGTNQPNWLTTTVGHLAPGIYLDTGANAVLDATTVKGNKWTTTGYNYGGGLYMNASTALLQNGSRVEQHQTTATFDARGAGIYLNAATLTLDHSTVTGNSGEVGAGIRVFNASVLNVLNGSSIDHNTASSQGGGIAVGVDDTAYTPDVNLTNATLQYNSAGTDGGAVYANAGTLDFTGWWDLRWNHADGNGGGLAVTGTADADLSANGGPSYLAVNTAGGNGGGIYLHNDDYITLYATSGHMTSFNTNTTSGNGGGAYADAGGTFDVYGNVQMTSNQAAGNGGLIYLSGGSRVWFDDYFNTRPQIWVNQAGNGGAVYADGSPRVELDGVDVGANANGNIATSGSGGAFYLNNSTFSADNCEFQNNKAALHGGAIAAFNSTLTLTASFPAPDLRPEETNDAEGVLATGCNPLGECNAYHDNLADSDANGSGNGGAIYLSTGSMTLRYTYLYNNQARRGGAIFQTGAGISTVENSLFHTNHSTENYGGGIRSEGGSFSVNHVTLADSIQGAGFSSNNAGSLVNNSIAWGNAQGGFWGTFSPSSACNIDQSGTVGSSTNPAFVGSGDYHLSLSSTVVDTCTTGLPFDLNYRARPWGPHYDPGAYEGFFPKVYIPMVRK